MKPRVLILGAGFGGLELSTLLSEKLGDRVETTLIEKSDAFVFGYSKLDVMFGKFTPEGVRIPYAKIVKPGVRLVRETVTSIDAHARRVTTDGGAYDADFLVVALGADYDLDATPGLREGGHEFYTVEGAARVREILPTFTGRRFVVGVCGAPYKCPPAPSEAALLLHYYLRGRGVRGESEITLVTPLPSPVPPSPDTSAALLASFRENDIRFLPNVRVEALDPGRKVALLEDGEIPYDLFLAIPRHVAPKAVAASGLAEGGWIPVNPRTLETRYPGVYAIGDVANTGTPKAGVFAEEGARSVATSLIAATLKRGKPEAFSGAGSCYVDFGARGVGRVDVDFFSGPSPTGVFADPSEELRAEKVRFGQSRLARWFGSDPRPT